MLINKSKYHFLKVAKRELLSFTLLLCLLPYTNINLVADDYSKGNIEMAIISKLSHYVVRRHEHHSNQFSIATFEQSTFEKLSEYFEDAKLQNKLVVVRLLQSAKDLKSQDLIFLENIEPALLSEITQKAEYFNILTLANHRGFADRGGMIQIYQVGQKFKLKINLSQLKKAGFKIHSSLLRISNIVKEKS